MFLSSLASPQPCRSRFAEFAVLVVIFVVFCCVLLLLLFLLVSSLGAGQAGWLELQADVDLGPDLKLREL